MAKVSKLRVNTAFWSSAHTIECSPGQVCLIDTLYKLKFSLKDYPKSMNNIWCFVVCMLGSEVGLLRGVEMAIGQMKVEESAKVTVTPQHGYGEAGNPELGIPGGAILVYFIRLNSFQKVCPPPWGGRGGGDFIIG